MHASTPTFLLQIALLIVFGRLLGEAAQRIGQPAVMGHLCAGLLLGPSVFGQLLPHLHALVFPTGAEQKGMLDAVSQLGVLMLLLLTGMETQLSVVRKVQRAAIGVSIAGIALPFACGYIGGQLLPVALIPSPQMRTVTALFLGTALAISSVKIVAMVIREMEFTHRRVGRVLIASAILDDTIGWVIVSVIFGILRRGSVDLIGLSKSIAGTLAFLAVSFTIGRRAIAYMIRWANDRMQSEMAVISAILAAMCLMALITDAIGVHTVLGAFVAGMLVGQSPILTRHIDEQLRGMIVALFMPIFFGLAGLEADLTIINSRELLLWTLGIIAIATLGKAAGAFVGALVGKLSLRESIALAFGMNARGSTEVIVATIGL
jgi:Kef-type K+ transport system membrane component KefB